MAYIDQYSLAQDSTFQQRVQIAVLKAAIDVSWQAQGNLSQTVFTKRNALASQILQTGFNLVSWSLMIVCEGSITNLSTDSDIQGSINGIFNSIAGITTND